MKIGAEGRMQAATEAATTAATWAATYKLQKETK